MTQIRQGMLQGVAACFMYEHNAFSFCHKFHSSLFWLLQVENLCRRRSWQLCKFVPFVTPTYFYRSRVRYKKVKSKRGRSIIRVGYRHAFKFVHCLQLVIPNSLFLNVIDVVFRRGWFKTTSVGGVHHLLFRLPNWITVKSEWFQVCTPDILLSALIISGYIMQWYCGAVFCF